MAGGDRNLIITDTELAHVVSRNRRVIEKKGIGIG
jgi:hypothetical protein